MEGEQSDFKGLSFFPLDERIEYPDGKHGDNDNRKYTLFSYILGYSSILTIFVGCNVRLDILIGNIPTKKYL